MADEQTGQLVRNFGRSQVRASAVGLGTWAIGGWQWGGTDEAESIDAIQTAIDEGLSLIDTAPAYGLGRSEEIVGRAIAGRRDQVVISTKCGMVWHTDKGTYKFDQAGKPVHKFLGRDSIVYEVEQSLRRLGTDRIDHYLTHWPDVTTPVDETMAALEQLKTQGKILSIGASNVTPELIGQYVDAGQLDAVQEKFNMLHTDIQGTLVPVCQSKDISIVSYSSLALGLLTGRITPERSFPDDDLRANNPLFTAQNRKKVAAFADAAMPVADEHDATLAQIVIAWTLQQPGITFALCGARNAAQARDNAKAGRIRLSAEDLSAIDAAAATHLADL